MSTGDNSAILTGAEISTGDNSVISTGALISTTDSDPTIAGAEIGYAGFACILVLPLSTTLASIVTAVTLSSWWLYSSRG